MSTEASKESKFVIIDESLKRLSQRIISLEDFLARLKESSRPKDTAEKQVEPIRSFINVYDSLASRIDGGATRIQKITEELHSILL